MYTEANPSLVLGTDLQNEFCAPDETGQGFGPIDARQARRFCPPIPQNIEATGLPSSLIEQLILKLLYYKGDTLARDLCRAVGLIFPAIEEIIDWFKHQQLIQVKSSLGYGPISATLALTEAGRRVARDYLENNQYVGPAPVPLADYAAGVQAQKLPEGWLTQERLAKAYSHMTVTPELLDQIGPAVSAGKSFLIYGQPGNGKTYLAEALFRVKTSEIFVPYALEYQGNIIQLYDPVYHHKSAPDGDAEFGASSEFSYDERWARCRRPFIATGGELSLSMLDLSCNPVSKIYDAPLHLKANNGIYLIDDFGRQKATPAEILNRWIVPMERRIDYLSFVNGGKMTVPFEAFLVFSTNLTPDKIGDEAFLRRIQYKLLVRNPTQHEFLTIFIEFCRSKGLEVPDAVLGRFISSHYLQTGKQFRRCHPRDVISHAIDYIYFKRLPYALDDDILDHAFASCFVSSDDLRENA